MPFFVLLLYFYQYNIFIGILFLLVYVLYKLNRRIRPYSPVFARIRPYYGSGLTVIVNAVLSKLGIGVIPAPFAVIPTPSRST